jgi:hypothetical protein
VRYFGPGSQPRARHLARSPRRRGRAASVGLLTHPAGDRCNVGRAILNCAGARPANSVALAERRQTAAMERHTAGSIPCGGARVQSATPAVDRAGVAQDTRRFRPRPFELARRAPWQRSGATLRSRPVSPQVLPETKRKQAWHSPVSPFRRTQPCRGLYLEDVMAITKRSIVHKGTSSL